MRLFVALLFYAILGVVAAAVAFVAGHDLLHTPSWAHLEGAVAVLASTLLGGILAAVTVVLTPRLVERLAWARDLHATLRPAVHGAGGLQLAATAVLSGVSEELFFRGMLVQVVGLVLASIAFGLLHQVKGPGRWAWATWAAVMGLLFGLVFRLTGSLVGPILAHVAINAANLRYLRDTPPRKRRHLGGLLGDA
jgi:membrane protease YdiL (CAAX protease family)